MVTRSGDIRKEFKKVVVSSWRDLDSLGDFHALEPSYVPKGLQLRDLSFNYSAEHTPPTTRNGVVAAFYTGEHQGERGFVLYFHGWGIGLMTEDLPESIPHGALAVGAYEAAWIRGRQPGGVGPANSGKPDDVHLRLGWQPDPRGKSGPGWRVATDILPMAELQRMMESLA